MIIVYWWWLLLTDGDCWWWLLLIDCACWWLIATVVVSYVFLRLVIIVDWWWLLVTDGVCWCWLLLTDCDCWWLMVTAVVSYVFLLLVIIVNWLWLLLRLILLIVDWQLFFVLPDAIWFWHYRHLSSKCFSHITKLEINPFVMLIIRISRCFHEYFVDDMTIIVTDDKWFWCFAACMQITRVICRVVYIVHHIR